LRDLARVRFERRPISADELADRELRAASALTAEQASQRRYRRHVQLKAALVVIIYAALWIATIRLRLDIWKAAVSTAVSSVVVVAAGVWDARRVRAKVARVCAAWAESIELARSNPVAQIDIEPPRMG
jgi:hypothetical protein